MAFIKIYHNVVKGEKLDLDINIKIGRNVNTLAFEALLTQFIRKEYTGCKSITFIDNQNYATNPSYQDFFEVSFYDHFRNKKFSKKNLTRLLEDLDLDFCL